MSKIVCDVCGAAYPESSSRCPVCGSVRYSTPEPVSDTQVPEGTENEAARPAGGRYTKTNVQKRKKGGKKNMKNAKYLAIGGAVIVLVVILLALLLPSGSNNGGNTPTEAPATNPPTEAPTNPTVPCTGIELNTATYEFTALGGTFNLAATLTPANTTDALTYTSSDPTVATVSASGQVTAVAEGTAVITVKCGDKTATCNITVVVATEAPTLPPQTLVLNRADFTLFYKDATWRLYSGDIDVSQITFTSDNESIATIDGNGKVTAVGRGTTTVHAEYAGQKVSCIVRCSFKNDTTQGGNGGVQEDNGNTGANRYSVYSQYGKVALSAENTGDVSIAVGEKVQLFLRDESLNQIIVEWTVSAENIVTVSGTEVTGAAKGVVTLSVTYEDVEYKCIVRVTEPQ